jgi:hypothetical protein
MTTISYAVELMDADDWLKSVKKKLQVVQCIFKGATSFIGGLFSPLHFLRECFLFMKCDAYFFIGGLLSPLHFEGGGISYS